MDTVTTRSNAALAGRVARLLAGLGFRVQVQSARREGVLFKNVVALRGPSGPPLLLNTHLDTVPPGPAERWTATGGRPFRLTRRGGRLHGLGVADVKLNLLCQLQALRDLGDAPFRRPLCVVGTHGEEHGMLGVQDLIRRWTGPRPFLALVGEPSEGRLIVRHRGYFVFRWDLPAPGVGRARAVRRIRFHGRSAHSSTPALGENAMLKALDGLPRWEGASVLGLDGGTAPNQVPAFCDARLGRADAPSVPWRTLRRGLHVLTGLFPASHSVNPGVVETQSGRLRVLFDLRHPPRTDPVAVEKKVRSALRGVCGGPPVLEVDRRNPPLAGASAPALAPVRAALRACGFSDQPGEKATCTEAGVYSRWGVPAAVWGPGRSIGNVHRPNESIALADLAGAVGFYRTLIGAVCLAP